MLQRFFTKKATKLYKTNALFKHSTRPYSVWRNKSPSDHKEKSKFWKRMTPMMFTAFAGMWYANSTSSDENSINSKKLPFDLMKE